MAAAAQARGFGPALLLATLCIVALVAWGHQRVGEASLGERMLVGEEGRGNRAEKQSLALEAVGRILQHHQPSSSAHKRPDYWPAVSFFAKRREEAWKAQKEAETRNAVQQELREQGPTGPNGQQLSPAQAAIAAKFDALSGASSKSYSDFRSHYEKEIGHKLSQHSSDTLSQHRSWGSEWRLDDSQQSGLSSRASEHRSFQQSLQENHAGEGVVGQDRGLAYRADSQRPPHDKIFARPYSGNNDPHEEREGTLEREAVKLKTSLSERSMLHSDKEEALEHEVSELKNELSKVEDQVEVRHGWEGGMHVEGGSHRSGAVWDGDRRRAVAAGSSLQEGDEGNVATGAEGEKDYDKYGVELDKWKDPTPLHYRDDIAGGVQIHTREDEIRKIHEYQARIAEEQNKMRSDWKKIMESPPDVTDATRPDIMDPDSYPTEGAAFRKKYQEMKDFKAAVEAFNHDPQFNPMIVLKAHHLVKYGIPAPESDSIDVWRQWYREALDKYHVVRHQVTDMASGNWHDYDTDWDIHGIHRPGAYKKVWRTRDAWGPGKPHMPLVASPDANFTLTAGGGVAEEAAGGEMRNETAAEEAEAEAETPGAADVAQGVEESGVGGASEGEAAAEAGADSSQVGSAQEQAPVVALSNKVDHLEKKLDEVVNLLESRHGAAATLQTPVRQHLAQQHLRKAYLPSAAERDRIARAQASRRSPSAVASNAAVRAVAADARVEQQQLRETATAAAVAALKSESKGASAAEEKVLEHPPKAVLNWLASALSVADKKKKELPAAAPSSAKTAQSLLTVKVPTAKSDGDSAPSGAASGQAGKAVPKAVQELIKKGTWQSGETVSLPTTAQSQQGPPLYTAADARKDAAAAAAAKAAITSAEKMDAADTVVHAKTSSKSVMQTGPDPALAAKAGADPLKRVAKAILVDGGSSKAKAAQAEIRKGDVDPEGKRDTEPVPQTLTKKFIGGRTMYLPKYDHTKTGGDGWGWLW